MRWRVLLVRIAFICALAGLSASPVFAHATLLSSEPADGAMAATTPSILVLTFNEPVSALVLRLIGPDGRNRLLPNPEGRHEQIEIPVPAALAKRNARTELARDLAGRSSGRRNNRLFGRRSPAARRPQLERHSIPPWSQRCGWRKLSSTSDYSSV
jgi:methionine-rich copper-binding protein CopC